MFVGFRRREKEKESWRRNYSTIDNRTTYMWRISWNQWVSSSSKVLLKSTEKSACMIWRNQMIPKLALFSGCWPTNLRKMPKQQSRVVLLMKTYAACSWITRCIFRTGWVKENYRSRENCRDSRREWGVRIHNGRCLWTCIRWCSDKFQDNPTECPCRDHLSCNNLSMSSTISRDHTSNNHLILISTNNTLNNSLSTIFLITLDHKWFTHSFNSSQLNLLISNSTIHQISKTIKFLR